MKCEELKTKCKFTGNIDEISLLIERISELGIGFTCRIGKSAGIVWIPKDQGDDAVALDKEMWLADIVSEYENSEDVVMSIEDIMLFIASNGLTKVNFTEFVPHMLRAVCTDDYLDEMEQFIAKFDAIDWNWWPNG